MGKRCIIVTKPIRELASQLNVNPNVAATWVGIWQSRNNSDSMPDVPSLQSLMGNLKTDKDMQTVIANSKLVNVETYNGYWTRDLVNKDKDRVYLFGDNTDDRVNTHYVPSSTQAVIRGLPNAIGIDTKKNRGTSNGITPQAKGKMTFSYGENKRNGVVSSTTIEAIKNGERTATTRYESDSNIEYWSKLKVGDFVEFTGSNGEKVIVKITKPLTKLEKTTDAEKWSKKEGWSVEYFNAKVRPRLEGAYQMEYEYVPNTGSSYFTDADFDQFKAQVDEAIQKAIDSGKTIVLPADGIGTGKAQLAERAPRLFKYLQDKLEELKSTVIIPENSIADKYIPEEINFDSTLPDITKTALAESATKLNSLFTPQQLSNRVKNVAYLFSHQVDILFDKKKRDLEEQLKSLPKLSLDRFKIQGQLTSLGDSKSGRTTFVSDYLNINDVIDEVRKDLQTRRNKVALRSTDNADRKAYVLDQYDKMIDCLDQLMVQALGDIEANEGIRIVVTQQRDTKGKTQLVGQQAQEEDDSEDDDDYKRVVSGNTGWAFKQREMDPHTSLTQNIRRILRQIPMTGSNSRDDLGFQRFVDSEFAYATILNGCTWMIDSDDFHREYKDANGETVIELPAIEALVDKYPWMQSVYNHLYTTPELIPEFYSCFRMDYIPYFMLSSGKFLPVNREMSVENAIDSITKNYEQGVTLSDTSIYNDNGTLNTNNAEKVKSEISQLFNDLRNDDFDEESYAKLTHILNSLGVEVDVSLKDFLALKTGNKDKDDVSYFGISKILTRASTIVDNLDSVGLNNHLINHFINEYRDIAKIVGSVTMFNRHMTFNQGENAYPSYSTPNFASTTIKRLLSPDSNRRRDILSFYKQANWFYNLKNGSWNNWMLEQFENNDALVEELRDGCLVNMNTIRRTKPQKFGFEGLFDETETVPYEKWTPAMIKQSFIKAYFSAGYSTSSTQQYAYYNFPIFSDTTCAMFMKFLRFTDNYEAEVLKQMRKVVIQELGRHKLVKDRKGKAAEIGNFDKNGDKFFFLTELDTYTNSPVPRTIIADYYYNQIQEARKTGDANKEAEASRKLNSLSNPDSDGNVRVLFEDAIRALRAKNNLNGINYVIDSAVKDILDKQYQSFLRTNVETNIPLITSLVEDNIIPKSELDKAIAKLSKDKDGGEAILTITTNKEGNLVTKKEDENVTAQYSTLKEALREYYFNNALMQTQIIELMVVDPAFYIFDGGIDFQKRFKEVFASGRKLDTSSKYGRVWEKTIYLTDRITTSRNYDSIKKLFDYAVANKHITQKQEDDILAKFREINNANAQALRCLDSMRAVLDMAHMWTDPMQKAFDSIKSGQWDSQNFAVIWQTIKPFMYSIIAKDDGVGGTMLVPHQNKNSEFLILAAYAMVNAATSGQTKLVALEKFMSAHDIDVVQYESAVKSGVQNPIDINIAITKNRNVLTEIEDGLWNNIEDAAKKELGKKYKEGRNKANFYAGTNRLLVDGVLDMQEYNKLMDFVEPTEEEIMQILEEACYKDGKENTETVHRLPYSDYMIAMPTPEHWIDSKVVDGSQKRNLLPADLPDDPNFRVVVNGIEMTKQEVLDLYNALIIENLLDDWDDVKGEVLNVRNLQKSLLEQIKGNPKYPKDFINALHLITYNGKEDFAVPIDFPSIRNKVAELILAKFKNKIAKQKVKGGSCILVADTQNMLNVVLEDGSVLDTSNKQAVEYAKKHNLIKGFECLLPAWTKDIYENYIITKHDENGNTWQELDYERLKEETPELLEMSGIRIPTEAKYSITPLIVKGFLPSQSGSAIMLPVEITTIAGVDFDVDKMFIRVYNHVNNDGKLEKVEYDYESSPEKQSREQRENALLDIELGILRSKSVAEALFDPGNFDPIKRESRIGQILYDVADSGDSLLAIWQEEHGIDYNDLRGAYDSVNDASLDELKSFVDRFAEKRSLLSLDTFIYNHQQNMAGAALIGKYANNTTAQAKMQTTRLELEPSAEFTINGRRIGSLHDIYSEKNGVRERISKRCAYFSAASVDNVKDPCLRKIGQNTNTAYITGFMLRAGMDVQEIALLFNQPLIKNFIDDTGKVPSTEEDIKKYVSQLNKHYSTKVDYKLLLDKISSHDFNSFELTKNIVLLNRNKFYKPNELTTVLSESERTAIVEDTVMAILLFDRIRSLADQLRPSVQISRADSPNGAIEHELHSANMQVRNVKKYMDRGAEPGWAIKHIEDIMANGVIKVTDSKKQMREKLLSGDVRVPRLQAFYSLGIELAQQLIARYFISQSPTCQDILTRIESELPKELREKDLKVLYNDYVTYLLTDTDIFGDSEEGTMEEKRDYYLYQFPQKFIDTLRDHPNLASSQALVNLRVTSGEIVMEKSGRVTPTLREIITSGFDTLLFNKEDNDVSSKLAYDLMRYSFYNEGFIFRHNSYGQFFSTAFLTSFPEMLNKLREVPDAATMNRFFEQWVAQNDNKYLFYQLPVGNYVKTNEDGSLNIEPSAIPLNDKLDEPYKYITYEGKIYQYFTVNEQGAIYKPINQINAGPVEGKLHKFNARKEASDIIGTVDNSRILNLRKLNSISARQLAANARKNLDDVASMADMAEEIPQSVTSQVEEIEKDLTLDVPSNFADQLDAMEDAIAALDLANQAEEFSVDDGQQTLIDKGEKILCPPKK